MTTLYVDSPPARYKDQLKQQIKDIPTDTKHYIKKLFQITNWLPNYNLIWLSGDLTAAITVGTLVIPQSLAYAKIANLPPAFGLYTSFVGVILYPLFGTSKDVSIGVSAITSLMVGQVIGKFLLSAQYLSGEWTIAQAAINLSLISGFAVFAIGLFRLGAIYNFICQPAISGFMAGSGLTIVINQFSKIFGIPNINTSQAPYLVFGKTLINLHHSTIDAAFGISALIWLYGVKYLSQHLLRRYPQHGRLIFFFNTSRSIVVLVFGTLLSFMINKFGHFEKSPISIIGIIPAGFEHMNAPTINTDMISFFGTDFIGIVILIIMEHGAIATSLGKVADYKVNMSNEMFATGLSNIFGAFFCSYPSTGAFSRTAVMSKSGTRTPLTSFFVGIIVVLAIYVFTPAFTYIPNASLAAIIAHSVTDLIFGPTIWKKFWDLNLTEILIFALAYIIALVARIDISVYVPVAVSLVVQLYRISSPQYAVLGRMDMVDPERSPFVLDEKQQPLSEKKKMEQQDDEESLYAAANALNHTMFYPLDHPTLAKYTRPIDTDIVCFQPLESIVFQNASYIAEKLLDEIKLKTRRGKPPAEKVGDRAWNNAESMGKGQERPLLRAVVLDLSGVHQMDYTGMEALRDVAIATERYTGHHVHWYIVIGESTTVRKSLLFAGFGNQRRNLKLPGQFLSDLLNGVEEGGHIPGIPGCCSHNVSQEKVEQELEDQQKNHNTVQSFDHIVTIEQARRPSRHLADQQSMTTLDNHSTNSDIVMDDVGASPGSTSESAQWCYCNIRSNPTVSSSNDETVTDGILAVYDVFPFFFKSLHDAVRAALLNKQSEELHDQELDKISIISDREERSHSPGGESSNSTTPS